MEETNADSLKVIKYIIKSAPYGESEIVLKDLSNLLKNTQLSESDANAIQKEHNEAHFALVAYPNENSKLVLAPFNWNDDHYVDQKNKKKVFVNHVEIKVAETQELTDSINEHVGKYRDAIDAAVQQYVNSYYSDDNSGYVVFGSGDESNLNIDIAITGKNLNLKNLYGGEWFSEWHLNGNKLKGGIKINAHYFEDGNVQLKQSRNFELDIELKDSVEAEAKAIVDFIKNSENQVKKGLDEIYTTLCDEVVKPIRKALPYTKQKMDWNIHAQKVVDALKKK